jgi:tRNA 2-thiocytidine biosynthesis protein TtcA
MQFPILPCDLCGSQEQLKRKQVKRVLAELEQLAPNVRESMLSAMGNVKAAHLLDAGLLAALGGREDAQDDGGGCGDGAVSTRPGPAAGTLEQGRRLPLVR